MKKITIFGSTGSVGLNALGIIREKREEFSVGALIAKSNWRDLLSQAKEFLPEAVCIFSEEVAGELRRELPKGVALLIGREGLMSAATEVQADMILAASSGSECLLPVLKGLESGKDIAVANKEILVMAGSVFMKQANRIGKTILPVDSEHNAIFQCLQGESGKGSIRKLLLTGSGGPLKDVPKEEFDNLTQEVVLKHPRWSMGPKITIDSATMMNKGLEIIEARWLFDILPDKIEVIIHPEAIVHSMVEFIDGSVIAQLGPTDMKLPILHSLSFPRRVNYPSLSTDFIKLGCLNFEKPQMDKFPCLQMAIQVAKSGNTTLPAVLNAVDEIAVEAYLNKKIAFVDIPKIIGHVLEKHDQKEVGDLQDILAADEWARAMAHEQCIHTYQ